MDIDLLSKMVKELILDDDKVVLPGLGSFVAEVVPSTFSDKGYTINPPYRRLFFRAGSDEGGALASFYASMNNVELEVAEKIISDFVAELKTILYTRKTVIFLVWDVSGQPRKIMSSLSLMRILTYIQRDSGLSRYH